jgi:FMN phosphatase YigB (HAD superfamily)
VPARIAFLLDVDNTLLDNDLVKQHIDMVLKRDAGTAIEQRFWKVYEDVRRDLDAVSVPVTLERLRKESGDARQIERIAKSLYSMPFPNFVYPGALELLRWLRDVGIPVILSDGDPWFQAKKITDAGLGEAVTGNVLIFLHKEKHVEDIKRWYPADRYFSIDDKPNLLSSLRSGFGTGLTTIWIRQGHYAQAGVPDGDVSPDYRVESIAELQPVISRALEGYAVEKDN